MVSFPQVSLPKPCIHLSSPPIRATFPAHPILDLITQTLLGEDPLALPSGSNPGTQLTVGWVGPRDSLDVLETRHLSWLAGI